MGFARLINLHFGFLPMLFKKIIQQVRYDSSYLTCLFLIV